MDIDRHDLLRQGSATMFGLAAGLLPCKRFGAIRKRRSWTGCMNKDSDNLIFEFSTVPL